MTEVDERDELWRRLKALESIGLGVEGFPPPGVGIIPQVGSEWNLVVARQPNMGDEVNWYVTDLGSQMLNEPVALPNRP